MKKFAFVVHLRENYSKDLSQLAAPLGWIPDNIYALFLRNRPIKPFIWSDITLTPGAREPEGHVIMLPYSGEQILRQQKHMVPMLEGAMKLAHSKGAQIMGLGGLISPISLGGKLIADNPYLAITNGNAFTAVVTYERLSKLINNHIFSPLTIALVGATGSVGTLLSMLLAGEDSQNEFLLVARNEQRTRDLAAKMKAINPKVRASVSQNLLDVKRADIVVLLTSATESELTSAHLKRGVIVLDDTQPRNTHPSLLKKRPDVVVIDGGLVTVNQLRCTKGGIGLPQGLSYAGLAETILLAKEGYEGNFCIGNPTLDQAHYIKALANKYRRFGFQVAPDYSFGKLVDYTVPEAIGINGQFAENKSWEGSY
ncbi:shikimate dehydrogenase [Dyadobacter luticola]|uniref:Shikimate dehydrogenase n=1 Tax=Dyadobacter luticola TaxID=1979387 RepID=A0A5R9L2N6_9BACT|nr:shikimate dehydrogenase [Dyadobacter luticola]TLV02844.1 shikimate dehydrogenase [Dyadobacter luticola]